MELNKLYESKTEETNMPASQRNAEVVFRGNAAYDKVLGVNVLIVNKDTGLPYDGANISVSVREKGGRTLLTPLPYLLIKHSPEVKLSERFIEFDDLKGNNLDTVVSIDASKMSEPIIVYTTILYSKAKK